MLGLAVVLSELGESVANSLKWYAPSGPLSGKSTLSILAFLISWVILHFVWKDKETDVARISSIAIALLVVGLLGTFPPVWELLARED